MVKTKGELALSMTDNRPSQRCGVILVGPGVSHGIHRGVDNTKAGIDQNMCTTAMPEGCSHAHICVISSWLRMWLVGTQDAVKSKTATVLAIDAARSRHPSMTYCDQNVVLQTPEEDRCPPVPGENPLIDLLQRCATCPYITCCLPHSTCILPYSTRILPCSTCALPFISSLRHTAHVSCHHWLHPAV